MTNDDALEADDWDDVPVEALDALEHHAIQSTQQRNVVLCPAELPPHPIATHPSTAVRNSRLPLPGQQGSQQALQAAPLRNASLQPEQRGDHQGPQTSQHVNEFIDTDLLESEDDMDLEEDVGDQGPEKPMTLMAHQERLRAQHQPATNGATGTRQFHAQEHQAGRDSSVPGQIAPDATLQRKNDDLISIPNRRNDDSAIVISPEPAPQKNDSVNTLQVQIEQLLRERDDLKQSLDAAASEIQAKTGEVKIVRANQARHEKELERRIIAQEKLQEVEMAKAQAELTKVMQERDRLQRADMFEQQDVREEIHRSKNARQRAREKGTTNVVPATTTTTTPKKNNGLSYRDGFDQDEIMIMSPSRIAGRSRVGTPKAGGKRKRKGVDDSPLPALQLSQSPRSGVRRGEEEEESGPVLERLSSRFSQADGRFEFLQFTFNHRMTRDQARTFESLTKCFLPSKPDTSLASLMLDEMNLMSTDGSEEEYVINLCQIFLTQWSRCIEDEYYMPVRYLVSLLIAALVSDAMVRAPPLTDRLVMITQLTAEINVIPRHHRAGPSKEKGDISVTDCLRLLHLAALGCVHEDESHLRFWQCMRFDFVFMLLHDKQDLEDVLLMLNILEMGVRDGSFGPIFSSGDGVNQAVKEGKILDRLVALLTPVMALAITTTTTTEDIERCGNQMVEVRIAALNVLGSCCSSPYTAKMMAEHDTIIGTLVRIMSDELDRLYDFRSGHTECAKQVNLSTRILFHLVMTFDRSSNNNNGGNDDNGDGEENVNEEGNNRGKRKGEDGDFFLVKKLAAVPGSSHHHRVGLSRLAFSQGLVLEKDIDDDVVDCARKMLDRVITPDEGEALAQAFGVTAD